MKKVLILVLTIVLSLLFLIVQVHAIENGERTVEMYDYYAGNIVNTKIYFVNDSPYIKPDDLAIITDYKYSKIEDKILFEKMDGLRKTKQVSIKNGVIQYGTYQDEVDVIDIEGSTYLSLTPTIDYLDARLRMSPDNQLVLFSLNKTFSQLVNQVDYDMSHGGNIEDHANELETGASWLWLLLNGQIVSSLPEERSRRLAYSLLTEEILDSYTIYNKTAIVRLSSNLSNDTDLFSSIGEFGDLEIFDNSLSVFGNRLKTLSKLGDIDFDILGRLVNIQLQTEQLYTRNIDNAEKVLLNSSMGVLTKNDNIYKNLKKIINGYDKKSEKMKEEALNTLYSDEGISFAMNLGEDVAASVVTKAIPALDAGLSLLKVYGNISGVTDGAMSAIEQKDYVALQSKVAIQLKKYHEEINNGKNLSKKEIINYVELARMYYHIKTAYYHMYNEYHPDPLFKDNYLMSLEVEKNIDQYGTDNYTLDIPNVEPTVVQELTFPEVTIPNKSIVQIKENKIYLTYIDTELTIPNVFIYLQEGFSPQAPQYDMFFQINPNSEFATEYNGRLSISCWNIYDYPTDEEMIDTYIATTPLSEKIDNSNYTEYSKYWGEENKYVFLSHLKMNTDNGYITREPSFMIEFIDLNNRISNYTIYIDLTPLNGEYHNMEESQFNKLYQSICSMIENCTFL